MADTHRPAALYCAERGGFNASRGAYALLGHAITNLFNISLPYIRKTETGKPYFPERPDIHFSLSHTKTHVLAAVSGCPVGADIETLRPVRGGVAGRVSTPDELGQFDFFELWVLKESFIKVSGETRVNLRDIRFKREGGQIITPEAGIRARLFMAIPGCAAAVCSMGGDLPDAVRMADLSKILAGY